MERIPDFYVSLGGSAGLCTTRALRPHRAANFRGPPFSRARGNEILPNLQNFLVIIYN